VGVLHDHGETRIPISRKRLVQPLTAHAHSARQFAEVPGTSDGSKRLSNERGIVASRFDGGLQVRGNVLDTGQVVGAVVGVKLSLCSPVTLPICCYPLCILDVRLLAGLVATAEQQDEPPVFLEVRTRVRKVGVQVRVVRGAAAGASSPMS
jgi:hypothetical protein